MILVEYWICPKCRKRRRTLLAWARQVPPSCAHLGTVRRYPPRETMVRR